MQPVEILPVQENLVLRARGSELLILPHHVTKLKGMQVPKDFTRYFMDEALVNRPARKLFEAWLRKDQSLWPRLFKCVHHEMDAAKDEAPKAAKAKVKEEKKAEKPVAKDEKKADKPAAKEAAKVDKPAAKVDKAAAPAAKPAKKDEKPAAKEKKAEKPAAPAKKAAAPAKDDKKAAAKKSDKDDKPKKKKG